VSFECQWRGAARAHERHPDSADFNVGINAGGAAGQTILHCYVHLIPRRVGDVEHPRGVVPAKRDYR
jgi:diadenosine tetraphosphate (Ap4A) HIT family hydrolase